MEKIVILLCTFLFVIQTARAQQNGLAALLGLGGFPNIPETQNSGSGSCPYTVHPDRTKFNQLVNKRIMTQNCAPGTMFVLSKCSCDNIPKGFSAGAPMPGSNPRLETGGGNNFFNALMSQLGGALGGAYPQPTPQPTRPSPRNMQPMNSNQLNSIRQKVTSGIRPDQTRGGTNANNFKKPQPTSSTNNQYNLDPSTGLTSVVDPSLLPDVFPPEILKHLQALSNGPPSIAPRKNYGTKQTSRDNRLPSSVQKMLNRASKPPARRPSTRGSPSPTKRPHKNQTPPTRSSPVNIGVALPPAGLPADVLNMLQKSIQPPRKRGNTGRSKLKTNKIPSVSPKYKRKQTPPPRRRQSPNRAPGPRRDPMADLMGQMTGTRALKPMPKPTRRGPRNDPLPAILGSSKQSSTRGTSRGTNNAPSRGTNNAPSSRRSSTRTPSRNSGSSPGGNQMAAMLAGLGGGPSVGNGADPFAALMANMGGGPGTSTGNARNGNGADIAALMAGIGGGSNNGSPGAPMAGNANAAALVAGVTRPRPKILDMTNFFNAQGMLPGNGGLSGLNNINYLKLRQLDMIEAIDMGDLTPAGLLAADRYFAQGGAINYA